jgi:hypothetical protein
VGITRQPPVGMESVDRVVAGTKRDAAAENFRSDLSDGSALAPRAVARVATGSCVQHVEQRSWDGVEPFQRSRDGGVDVGATTRRASSSANGSAAGCVRTRCKRTGSQGLTERSSANAPDATETGLLRSRDLLPSVTQLVVRACSSMVRAGDS